MTFSESAITSYLSDDLCKQITRKVIHGLQQMNTSDHLLSGDDSGLANTWDEICLQFQDEMSISWSAYELTIFTIVEFRVTELKDYEKTAIWLQTDEGSDWIDEDQNSREEEPVLLDSEIVDYILQNYVYQQAGNWSNKRITAFIERNYY